MMNRVKDMVSKLFHPAFLFSPEPTKRKRSTEDDVPTKLKYDRSVIKTDPEQLDDDDEREMKRRRITKDQLIPTFYHLEPKFNYDPTKSPLFSTPMKSTTDTHLFTRPKSVEKNVLTNHPRSLPYIERLRQRTLRERVQSDPSPIPMKPCGIQCDIETVELEKTNEQIIVPEETSKSNSSIQTESSITIEISKPKVLGDVTPFSWPKFARAQDEFSKKYPEKCRIDSSASSSSSSSLMDLTWKCSLCTKENSGQINVCALCFAVNPNCKRPISTSPFVPSPIMTKIPSTAAPLFGSSSLFTINPTTRFNTPSSSNLLPPSFIFGSSLIGPSNPNSMGGVSFSDHSLSNISVNSERKMRRGKRSLS